MNEALLINAIRLHQAGNLLEAARLYSAVLQASPHNFHALYLLGFVHFQQGRFPDAAHLIGEAVKINPHAPDAFYNLGCALQPLNRHGEAVAAFDRAVALKPDYAEALINRGVALMALKRQSDAVTSFDRALGFTPRDTEALSNRATALFELKRYEDAAAGFARLLDVAPEFPNAPGNLALARAYACEWRHHEQDQAQIRAALSAGRAAVSPHGSTLILDDPGAQLACARQWVADRCPPSPMPLWRGELYRHEKIRIAYVSADFHAHATAFLMAGVFEQHDRSRFEINLISFSPDDKSDVRARLARGADRFIDISDKSDAEAAVLMRQMEIDIAVDLKGFTDGCRTGIFAQRPSPLQVNYLAHPGTMAAPYMDYLLADAILIPPEHRGFYSENIVLLPDTYQANDSKRAIPVPALTQTQAGLPESGFVFACFNNSYKITPRIFDIWMQLLKAVDGVLWLLDDNQAATANLKREAEARGVPAHRLVFAPRTRLEDHLARHALADLFLDTLPCSAHTTASDALWMGLPVLTVLGSTFAGRVSASLLSAAGLSELIAPSLKAYESVALELARNPEKVAALKSKLQRDRHATALFDTARFTRHLESGFTTMWERYRRGEPPAAFAVPRVE